MSRLRSMLFTVFLAAPILVPEGAVALPIALSDLIHLYTIDLAAAATNPAGVAVTIDNAEAATVDPDGNLWLMGHTDGPPEVGFFYHLDPTQGAEKFLSSMTSGSGRDGEGVAYANDRLLFTETPAAGRVDEKALPVTVGGAIVGAGPFGCGGLGVPCREPEGLAFDDAVDRLWVVDEHEEIVFEASLAAVALSSFDVSGLGLGGPEGITLFNDNLLVVFDDDDAQVNDVDLLANDPKIVEYAKDGTKQPFEILLRDLTLPASVINPDPEGIAWDPDAERLYVVDSDNLQIYVLGTFIPEPSAATLFAMQTIVVVGLLRKRRLFA